MSEPVVYVSTWRIKPGAFEDYRRFYAELVRIAHENGPRIAAFLAFANDDQSEITYVHVYPDGETLEGHMAVLAEKMGLLPDDLRAVMRYTEPVRIEVFGTPGGRAAAMDSGLVDSGVPFTGKRRYLGGFTRGPDH